MRKIYRRKEEGIASTVGTIFALMIFTALLGMFMTQVVPVTMKDNEARHDAEVLSQLSQLRSEVDILTLTRDTNYTAYVPVKLGADGVPLFASPTYGQLSLYPSKLSSNYVMNVSFTDKYGNLISRGASGSLQFIAPNKYYVPELFEYANGAILRYNFNAKKAVFAINPNVRFQAVSLGSALNVTPGYASVNANSLNVSKVTLELWFNLKTVPSTTTDLIVKTDSYGLQISQTGITFFVYVNGAKESIGGTASIKPNVWYYAAGVFDGNTLYVYLDDKLLNSNSISTSASISTSSYPLQIGEYVSGYLDEIRLLSVALNEQEIKDDYYAGVYYPERVGAVVWYHCDNLTSTGELYDSSPYHNDGTLYGAELVARTGVNIALTLQNIFGRPDSVTGTETRNIAIKLYGVSDESYSLNGGILNITFSDYYQYSKSFSLDFSDYWITYVNNTLKNIGLKYDVDYVIIPSEGKITIFGANNVNLKMVYLNFEIER